MAFVVLGPKKSIRKQLMEYFWGFLDQGDGDGLKKWEPGDKDRSRNE